MQNIYTIYYAVNKINGKMYIGYTKNFKKRIYAHLKNSFYKCISGCKHFYSAIRKYNIDAFQWGILYQSPFKHFTLNVMEPFFIEKYNTIKNGYNIDLGGLHGAKNRKISNKQREKCSERTKGYKNPFFGKTHSEQTKKILSDNHSLNDKYLKDPNGNVIHITNIKRFCRENNLNRAHINEVLNGNRKSHKKYTALINPNQHQ